MSPNISSIPSCPHTSASNFRKGGNHISQWKTYGLLLLGITLLSGWFVSMQLFQFTENDPKKQGLLRVASLSMLSREEITQVEEAQTYLTITQEEEPTAPPISYESGIILALHNDIVPMGASVIRELRCLGNQDIIQVFHCFEEEMSSKSRKILTRNETKVQIIDVCTQMVESGKMDLVLAKKFANYWIKPLALWATNISHVILMDADVLLMRDPAVIRTMTGYNMTGTMFFHDRVIKKEVNFNSRAKNDKRSKTEKATSYLKLWIEKFPYKDFGLPGPNPSQRLLNSFAYRELSAHEQDSSVVAVDKRRAGKALDVLWYMITEKRLKYKFSWGDKEAFWLSWEFSQTPYAFSPWGIAAVESAANMDHKNHPMTLCGNMAHYLPDAVNEPELLYVNAKSILEPYPKGAKHVLEQQKHVNVYNFNPRYITPRQVRHIPIPMVGHPTTDECLMGLGAMELPPVFYRRLLRRREHIFALHTGFLEPLEKCGETDLLIYE